MTKRTKIRTGRARIRQAKRWCLTVHGATQAQLDSFKHWCEAEDSGVELAVVAREGGESGLHPHFQAYFELGKVATVRNRLKDVFRDPWTSFHAEAASGTREANLNYVYAVNKPHEIGFIVYRKGDFQEPPRYCSQAADEIRSFKPRPFQKQVLDLLTDGPDERRTIHWFFDEEGNKGKSYVGLWLHWTQGALLLEGSGVNMKHALARVREVARCDPPMVIVDFARLDLGVSSRSTVRSLESTKGGAFFSEKYESTMVAMKRPVRLVCFANRPPNPDWFSRDRWKVWEIDDTFVAHRVTDVASRFDQWFSSLRSTSPSLEGGSQLEGDHKAYKTIK